MKLRDFPWRWVLVAILLLAGLTRLRFDVEVLNLLPSHLPAVQGLQLYQQYFANTRELLVTLEAPDPDRAEAAARSLAGALRAQPGRIESVTWQSPGLEHPDELAAFIAYLWLNQPTAVVDDLVARLQPDALARDLQETLEEMATTLSPDAFVQLAHDPLRLTCVPGLAADPPGFIDPTDTGVFASADGRFRVLFLQGPDVLDNFRACAAWVGEVDRAIDDWRRQEPHDADLRIALTGQPAFIAEIGGGMQKDLFRSVTGMFLVISALFALVHGTWWPLQKLLVSLLLVLTATLALGGLAFGELNLVSVGFAAMLLALAVDYGLVLYQESRISPALGLEDLRRTLAPGIWWAALTTAGAFLAASLARLPGIVQMGLLVGCGILLAAVVMLYVFLPWVHRPALNRALNPQPKARPTNPAGAPLHSNPNPTPNPISSPAPALILTGLLALGAAATLATGWPAVDRSTDALRPTHSPALQTFDALKLRLGHAADPSWLIVAAPDDATMVRRLDELQQTLRNATADGSIRGVNLPAGTWPHPARQSHNRATLVSQLPSLDTLAQTVEAAGFTRDALALLRPMLNAWTAADGAPDRWPPSGDLSRWILDRSISRQQPPFHALGLVYPWPGSTLPQSLRADLDQADDAWLTSWEDLGSVLLVSLADDLRVVLPAVALLLLLTLSLTFRHPREIGLGLASLGLSLLLLLALMRLTGWSWNLMNLVALPVLLGTGIDYAIHMQLALRRHQGSRDAIRRGVGRALLLCGATTIAGFGSLAFSTNAGLASLGRICASGMVITVITTVFLLPTWWRCTRPNREAAPP